VKQKLLRSLNVAPGQKIGDDKRQDGRLLIRTATQTGSMEKFSESLKLKGGPMLSIAQIKTISADGERGSDEYCRCPGPNLQTWGNPPPYSPIPSP
jgi:hypothetical protein